MYIEERYLQVVNRILNAKLKSGMVVVDETCGKGNDSLNMISRIGETGFLYGFDVQKEAIEITANLLKKNGYSNYKIIHDSHENIREYIQGKVDFFIYNLGYLPGFSKSIATNKTSTLKSIDESLKILKENGVGVIVQYIGHENSFEEYSGVDEFLSTLNQREFIVQKISFHNQVHTPPVIYLIERKKWQE